MQSAFVEDHSLQSPNTDTEKEISNVFHFPHGRVTGRVFLLKQTRLKEGGKHAPGKEFQRDAVRGIKLMEWLLVLHECMDEKKQKVWFHTQKL